ncbi:MAG: glycosyltransferase family 4 protein [Actinomycetes bacterium]
MKITDPRTATTSLDRGGHSSPRILFLCSQLGVGGVERLWASLLPSLEDEGATVTLVALNKTGATYDLLQQHGIATHFIDAPDGPLALSQVPKILRLVRAQRPTVIMTFGPSTFAIGAIVGRLTRVPSVINWHQGVGLRLRPTSRLATKLAARLGSRVIAVSDANRPDLMKLGFMSGKIVVIPNGVVDPPVRKARADRPSVRPTQGKGTLVLAVARLSPEKRLERFIEALAIASDRDPSVRGEIVGSGPLESELRTLITMTKAPVALIGFHPEPTELMIKADIVCLTSDYETAPLALMEAAACGIPTVSTNVGGVSEIVEHGTTGLLAKELTSEAVANAIVELASDPDSRREMGAAARDRWSRLFSLERTRDAYLYWLGSSSAEAAAWRGLYAG